MRSDLDRELEGLRIVRTPEKRETWRQTRWIAFSGAVMAIGTAATIIVYAVHSDAALVEVTRVVAPQRSVAEDDPVVLNATGYIVAHHEIQVASKVSGKVAWIGVEEGGIVNEGQVLVRLDDTEYSAQLKQAKGNLANLQAKLLELQHGSRPQEVSQALANLVQSEADLTNSKLAFERSSALYSDGIISRADFDTAQYNYRSLEARAKSLRQAYDLVEKGPRHEEVDAMKGLVEQAEGLLAYDEDEENNTVIRSPINGRVLERAVERGEYVTNGFVGDKGAKGYVVTLADLNDLQVELDISENDFSKIRMGSNAVVTTDAFPDSKYDGQLVEIAPIANRQKATVRVKLQILHPDDRLRPDMNASVAFVDPSAARDQHAGAAMITIPTSAIRDQSVFIVLEGKAVRRHVQVAETTPQGVRLGQGGLDGGEELILNPPTGLRNGEKVRIKGDQP